MGLDIGLDAFGTRASRRDRERIGAERFECFYDMEGIVVFEHPGRCVVGDHGRARFDSGSDRVRNRNKEGICFDAQRVNNRKTSTYAY